MVTRGDRTVTRPKAISTAVEETGGLLRELKRCQQVMRLPFSQQKKS
jgi:hypothetical protein